MFRISVLLVSVSVWFNASPAVAEPMPLSLEGRIAETARLRMAIAANGLPEQITIKAIPSELPLEARKGQPDESLLRRIGRGPQLAEAIQLTVTTDGQTAEAKAAVPSTPALDQGDITCTAQLVAGPAKLTIKTRYQSDGSIHGDLDLAGGPVEAVTLTLSLAGKVDTIVPGEPVHPKIGIHKVSDFAAAVDDGFLWQNAGNEKADGPRSAPGPVQHLFIGTGDRGVTFLSNSAGWIVDPAKPTASLSVKDGKTTLRILFVNKKSSLKGKISFALLVHPSTTPPTGREKTEWLQWPKEKPINSSQASLAGRQKVKADQAIVSAGHASLFEGSAKGLTIHGIHGGQAVSAKQDLASSFPLNLFRYYAGTHMGLPARIESNSGQLIRPGMNRSPDRVVLGRALLHDIGADVAKLAHLTDGLRVVKALNDFGYFTGDGNTEFIPYWRSSSVVSYGETFDVDDAFSLSETDPLARVHVSVYRRPLPKGRGTQAMIVIHNESDAAVRDQIYIRNPMALFGGPNRQTLKSIVSSYDFSRIPDISDWGKPGVTSRDSRGMALRDMEDNGVVAQASNKDGIETYGPHIFIPAHNFRIFFGKGR